jgi:outer membrane receptor protein involved in Fe transport
VITTKKGKSTSQEPRIELTQRFGTFQLSNTLGSRVFGSLQEAQTQFPGMDPRLFTGQTYDHERQLSGRTDLSTETYASISGSAGQSGETTYFASALVKGDNGIMIGTGYDKQAARMNLGRRFGEDIEMNVSTNLTHSVAKRGLSNNDNAGISHYMVFASTPSFMNLSPDASGIFPRNPFGGGGLTNPLQTATLMRNDEEVWRLVASGDLLWKVWKNDDQEIKVNGSFGVDRFQQKNKLLFPPELNFEPLDDQLPGTNLFGTADNLNLNWGFNGIHSYKPTAGFFNVVTSSVGISQEVREMDSTGITTRNLVPNQSNVDTGAQTSISETRTKGVDRGVYLQEEALMMNERLQLVGAVRAEQSSLNGDPNLFHIYPKIAASYRMEGLPTWFEECKLRAAYGETGNLPTWGSKFTAVVPTASIGSTGVVVIGGTIGDPNIRPERQREVELGVDTLMLNGSAVVELTVYQRQITDMLLRPRLAPSTGFSQRVMNGGEMINRGFEAMVQLTPVQTEQYSWSSRATFALNRSVIADLPIPAFDVGGFGLDYGSFRIEEGASATQIIGYVGKDASGKPLVGKVGDAEPIFKMSFINDFKYGPVSLSTNVEWQQGSQVVNLTRALYDMNGISKDYTTEGVKRIAMQQDQLMTAAYVEDATFLKLREVTVSFEVPQSMMAGFAAVKHAKVSVSGRNLLTWTTYSGLDPEVSNFGNQAIARNIDVAPFPPSRSVWGSIEVGF